MAFSLEIGVNTGELASQAAVVESAVNDIVKQLSELDQLLQGTSSYWMGDGGNSYRRRFKERCNEATQLMQRLQKYAPDLRSIAGIYDSKESDGVNEAKALVSSVDLV